MPEIIELIAPHRPPGLVVPVPASKSISNRLLILNAVSGGLISGLEYSDSEDTRNLMNCLFSDEQILYVGEGGTNLRFLLAYYASLNGADKILKGSERLMQRPIEPLMKALNELGAEVNFVDENRNYGIRVLGKSLNGGFLKLEKSVSSQFATAILLSSPNFNEGVRIMMPEDFPSFPYLKMTAELMKLCGYNVSANLKELSFKPSNISPIRILVEKDWSSASYWYGIVALYEGAEITLEGLSKDSLQGDVLCAELFSLLGVHTEKVSNGLKLTNRKVAVSEIAMDVSDCPDLFPALAFAAAGKMLKVYYSGLSTLKVKESNRVFSVTHELSKANVSHLMINDDLLCVDARNLKTDKTIVFDTHQDHRIAMAASILSCVIWKVCIRSPYVVGKSYPSYWQHLSMAGFSVNEFES